MDDNMASRFRTVTLQRIRVRAHEKFPGLHVLDLLIHEEISEHIAAGVCTDLSAWMWGNTHKVASVQYPATWWDAFKDRWFPWWAKNLWHVKYTTKTFTIEELYPTLNISLPDNHPVLHLRVSTERKEV
jgi:hypothetical protein